MRTGQVNKRSKKIGVYKGGVRVATYDTMSIAARDLGIAVQNIWRVLKGYRSTLKGYEFRYEEEV